MALSEEAVVILKRRQTTAATSNQYVFLSISHTGHLLEPKKGRRRVLNDDRIINKYRQCFIHG